MIRAEIWDAYDKEFNKIENVTLIRGEDIPKDMHHLVSEIIVKHKDGTYLLMQRDFEKSLGGKWEVTAGGAALKGETSLDCAIRELREETGIISDELKEIGRIVHDGYQTIFVEYLCITDWHKDDITLQNGETIDYKWVDKDTLLEIDDEMIASPRTLELIRKCKCTFDGI